jgi:apolipoprotein N-acyltransferase
VSTAAIATGAGAWLAASARRVGGLTGWRRTVVGVAAGGLSTLAHAPFFAWPVLFATFPVLYWAIEGAGRQPRPYRAAASSAWAFGFGYFFFGLYWIGEAFLVQADVFAWMLPFAVTLLPAAMAVYWALAAVATRALWVGTGLADDGGCGPSVTRTVARVLGFAIALSLAEIVRGHAFTGFPWNTIGLALTAPLELMQIAGMLGMYGLTPVASVVTTVPLAVLTVPVTGGRRASGMAIGAATVVPLVAAYVYGAAVLAAPPSPPLEGVRLRIVQPSIPQREKWRPDLQGAIFERHLDLTRRAPDGRQDDLAGITHVIWPEASMPFGPLHTPEALAAIADLLPAGVHLLAGILRRGSAGTTDGDALPTVSPVHNSLAAFDGDGQTVALYDKIHLVPFGEYLPLPRVLERVGLENLVRQRGGFSAGVVPKPTMRVPGLPSIAPIICYEAIFPGEIVQGEVRPGLLVIVTNDGWFGHSIGPAQHFHVARVRAVEQGITVVRAANNGISAVIDPEGRIVGHLDLDARATLDSHIPRARQPRAAVSGLGLTVPGVVIFLFSVLIFTLRSATRGRPAHPNVDVNHWTSATRKHADTRTENGVQS